MSTQSLLTHFRFVYGGDKKIGNEDRAREAYDTFLPLDGKFEDNGYAVNPPELSTDHPWANQAPACITDFKCILGLL